MGRGVNWEDEWEDEEELIVRELARKMEGEDKSIGEKVLAKERRGPWKESMTFAWVSKHSIALQQHSVYPVLADTLSKQLLAKQMWWGKKGQREEIY
jgi:hypothetical protein